MSKDINSKKKNWEKLSQVDTEFAADKESILKDESTSEKKIESSPTKLTHPSYEALEKQLLEVETQLEEHKSKLIQYKEQDTYRLAEMENIRRRSKLDIENAYKFSLKNIIQDLLPVKDSLEAALTPSTVVENDPTLKGVQLTLQALQKVFEKNGVKSIEPVTGDHFDPHYHQAMLTEVSNNQAPNTILKILQKGYLLNERLLRPAMVVVAKASEEKT